MGENAMNRNQNDLTGQKNTDGYKPVAVPKAFRVIQGNAENGNQEAAVFSERQIDAYCIPRVIYDGGTIHVPRERHE
ncbi:hypothetical protein ACFQI7_09855 [Paenibacillus allorhizosphaerae]|uniref:Uncharacterized protein n=1 Tax=Paenibacillus allorhizosphaerae TaxID=2849866 RepID=A0ABM8VIS9_9BACL|nr:hypothetical protein [Paenibacillus allorhizosphaerae]CAG7644486.1 hypothetical protein PAECIP111802_03282 [Paenibacillus allorhizosphaerae]